MDLPVGEPNPRVRLARLSYAMRGIAPHGQSVGADSLIALTGFAPPTLHALGARAARGLSRRLFNLVVTNVPGPQVPLYAAGSRMLEVFPVVPLARGQGLSIGMTSYDGRVFFGLNADRDSVGDVDVLADLIEQEVGELVETRAADRRRRDTGRRFDRRRERAACACTCRPPRPCLRTLVDDGRLPGPHTAFAVTPQLREFYALSDAEADTEELEYAALLAAARASLRLLDVDPIARPAARGAGRRRARRRGRRPIDDPDTDRGAVRVDGRLRCATWPARTSTAPTPRTTSAPRSTSCSRPTSAARTPSSSSTRPRVTSSPGTPRRRSGRRSSCSEPPPAPAAARSAVGGRPAGHLDALAGGAADQPARPGPDGQRGPRQSDAQEVGVAGPGAQQQAAPARRSAATGPW